MEIRIILQNQARRQDSVTGGQKEILGVHEKSILCEFERGTGAQEIYPCLDQRNKVWCENSKGYSGQKHVISKKKIFAEISRHFPAEIGNSSGFSGQKQVISKKKKVFAEISRDFPAEIGISSGFSSFKSTKNTNLGLDLRSKAPNLLISSGHSLRLGGTIFVWGAQAVSWGAGPRYALPWRRVCAKLHEEIVSSFKSFIVTEELPFGAVLRLICNKNN